MCGIAGFVNFKNSSDVLRDTALRMSNAISKRGPDADGVWTDQDNGIAFSHRRLSIVDLSPTGAQPMKSSCENLIMVYNGEIYNASELKTELEKLGSNFRGTSDTEVILEGYSKWGIEKTTEKLIGMFAMAVWNRSERTITLVRDRLGIKPLYWTIANGILIFGSELKALRQHPNCPVQLNNNAIVGYLRNSYINSPSSIYTDVNKLQTGTILTWPIGAEKPSTSQYWSLKETVENSRNNMFKGSLEDAVSSLDGILGDAVKRRMIADVPLGAFLSGGIDSSAIVALMQKHSSRPVKTFSIGFNEKDYDESAYASAVAKHLGTEHKELFVTAKDAIDVIPELPNIYDEPFADPSQIPTFLLSKLTREHVTVALSGDGGDELFTGYQRYFDAYKARFLIKQPKLLRNAEAAIIESISPDMLKRMNFILPSAISKRLAQDKIKRFPTILRDGSIESLYRRYLSRMENPEDSVIRGEEPSYLAWQESAEMNFADDDYSAMQYIDTLDYLPDDILTKVDRASMANSLEARVPMLDHRVVGFAWQLPNHMKVQNGKGKWVLRKLLNQYLPEKLIDRPKMGFGVPIGLWLKGPLRDWGEELLSEQSLKQTDIFNPIPIRKKWKQHLDGDYNWEYHLWDVLMMQSWITANNSN